MSEVSGVAKEIEHKYLLSDFPFEILHHPKTSFYTCHHGWLPGKVIQERITINSRNGGEIWRTIKTGKGLERIEAQEKVEDKVLGNALFLLTTDKRVSKVRYVVEDPTGLWEIDVFLDRNLVLAEIEVPSVDTKITPPNWLKNYIVREVTEEPEYLNINLAKPV